MYEDNDNFIDLIQHQDVDALEATSRPSGNDALQRVVHRPKTATGI